MNFFSIFKDEDDKKDRFNKETTIKRGSQTRFFEKKAYEFIKNTICMYAYIIKHKTNSSLAYTNLP